MLAFLGPPCIFSERIHPLFALAVVSSDFQRPVRKILNAICDLCWTGLAAVIIIVIAISVGLCVAAIGILTIRR